MRKKIVVEKVEEVTEVPQIEVAVELDLVSEELGRDELNKLARKVNELIRKCL